MITLNKLAQLCLIIFRKRFRLKENASQKALGNFISVCWRNLDILDTRDDTLLPERKKRAADIIIGAIAYLKALGCEDIERLIKDRIKEFE